MSIEIRGIRSCVAQEEACALGSRFPKLGHSVPIVCSVDAPALFIECPDDEHRVFKCWLMEVCRSYVLYLLSLCYASMSFQCRFYDTLVILL